MQYGKSKRAFILGLIAGSALSMAAVAQEAAPAAEGGVTFTNGSDRHITFYTRYGSDASCSRKPKSQSVSIAPGQSVSVPSGDSAVCYCLQVPNLRSCPSGWGEVAAGGTRNLR